MQSNRLFFTPFIIGVAGGSGSGKTTVSQHIRAMIDRDQIAYLQHDSYYFDHSHQTPAERALRSMVIQSAPGLVRHVERSATRRSV